MPVLTKPTPRGLLLRDFGAAGGTGIQSTQRQPQPLHLLPRSVTLASFFWNRGKSTLWRSNTASVKTPGPSIAGGLQPAALQPLSRSFKGLSSSHPPYHFVKCGGVIYTPHTLEPLKGLGLDTLKATKLALELRAHSVQYAY
eukprot:151118-Pelagomonas_calceolata.AAC.1